MQRLAGIANAVVLPLGGRDRRNGGEHTNRNARSGARGLEKATNFRKFA